MSESEDRLVYIVTSDEWGDSRNYSTGTKIYEYEVDAAKWLYSAHYLTDHYIQEFKLVPTGNLFDKKGNRYVRTP